MPVARRWGILWLNNVKMWTGLPVEESVRITEDRQMEKIRPWCDEASDWVWNPINHGINYTMWTLNCTSQCYCYFVPGREGVCNEYLMSLFVSLSIYIHVITKTTRPIFTDFLCMLPTAIALLKALWQVIYFRFYVWHFLDFTAWGQWARIKHAIIF